MTTYRNYIIAPFFLVIFLLANILFFTLLGNAHDDAACQYWRDVEFYWVMEEYNRIS